MESLIGKYYSPYDNSYSVNLTSCSGYSYENKRLYLAGTSDSGEKMCLIVSEPFLCKVRTISDNTVDRVMILVEYDGNTVSVMFHESRVIGDKIMDNGVPLIWE